MTSRQRLLFRVCSALIVAFLGAGEAGAAISTTGQVDPADPAQWTSGMVANVGRTAEGSFVLDGGSTIDAGAVSIGAGTGGNGQVTITEVGSSLNLTGILYVGDAGTGLLTISHGGALSSGRSMVGSSGAGMTSQVVVDGMGSFWDLSSELAIGKYGAGKLDVRNGALVRSERGVLSDSFVSNGVATISGLGSKWEIRDILMAAGNGTGSLRIDNGGAMVSERATIGYLGSATGEAIVTGAGSSWSIGSTLVVGHFGTGALHVTDGGVVQVGAPGVSHGFGLGLSSATTGDTSDVVTLDNSGVIRLYGGPIFEGSGAATFNFNGGRLEGVGTYQVGAGLTQNGGVLAPGNSAGVTTIVGSYALNGGTLEIELLSGSGVAGTAFDQLVVNSGVTLGASSQLNLLLGYAATVGDSFLIVDGKNASPVNGTFANDNDLTAEFESLRYSFSLNYAAGTGNDIAVTVASVALIGDYNADGFVDAADYTVWRDAVGTSGVAYAGADGNGDGVVDESDHVVWMAHFGASLEAAMARAVPEPISVVLAVLALIAGRRRRRS